MVEGNGTSLIDAARMEEVCVGVGAGLWSLLERAVALEEGASHSGIAIVDGDRTFSYK